MNIVVDNQTVIVFDLDDTLYNEIAFLRSAYKEIARQLAPSNWLPLYGQLFARYRNNENVFHYLEENFDTTSDTLIKQYRNHVPDIDLFAGVTDLFNEIEQLGGKMALVTDGRSVTQRNKIQSLGIGNRLAKIVISEEIGSEKPSLTNFQTIEAFFNSTHYVYIGDNLKKDFIAPNQLGWSTLCKLDQGLNIHSNAHRFTDQCNLPRAFFDDYRDLQVVPREQI
jgi:putative hydrolase of the HAD superfamily